MRRQTNGRTDRGTSKIRNTAYQEDRMTDSIISADKRGCDRICWFLRFFVCQLNNSKKVMNGF